jgi:hypothetical protein
MGKFMRLVARALVGVAALVCAAGAQAVTLPPHFQETVAIDGLDNPTAVRFAADGRDASEEERSWGTKSRPRRRQRSRVAPDHHPAADADWLPGGGGTDRS